MMTIYLLRIRLAGNGWSKPGALIGDIGAMRPVLQDMRSLRGTKYHNVHMLRCAHAIDSRYDEKKNSHEHVHLAVYAQPSEAQRSEAHCTHQPKATIAPCPNAPISSYAAHITSSREAAQQGQYPHMKAH
jgi:hypothetical protein